MEDTKYECVMKGLLMKIETREWLPGEQILSERKLTELFDVSRVTVQRAVDELVERGVLEHLAGRKGTYVCAAPTLSDRRESRLIGVAVDDVSDLFGARILRGIEDCLWGRKYHTIICNADRNLRKVQDYFRSLAKQNIDGVIFSPVIVEEGYVEANLGIVEELRAGGRPFVLIDRTIPGLRENYVSTEHRDGSRRLVGRFLESGARKLILFTGLPCSSIGERERGFEEALREAGLDPASQRVIRLNDNLMAPGMSAGDPYVAEIVRMIGSAEGTEGIVALNGRLMRGAALALTKMGFPLGRFARHELHGQFAVELGDEGLCLVSVQPAYQLGYEAARLLLQRLDSRSGATMSISLDAEVRPFEA